MRREADARGDRSGKLPLHEGKRGGQREKLEGWAHPGQAGVCRLFIRPIVERRSILMATGRGWGIEDGQFVASAPARSADRA